MCDLLDSVQENDARYMEAAIKLNSVSALEYPYTGFCLSCGPDVKLESPKRWCDKVCMDNYIADQRKTHNK